MQIKGYRDGVMVYLDPGSYDQQRDNLMNHIRTREKFYFGSQIAINLGDSDWNQENLKQIIKDLKQHEVTLISVLSNSSITKEAASACRLEINQEISSETDLTRTQVLEDIPGKQERILLKSIEKGESIVSDSDVCVFGNVSKGAELITTGNIIIWGEIHGSVIAGYDGNMNSVIAGLKMNPEKLVIANIQAIISKKVSRKTAVVAQVIQNAIVFTAWNRIGIK